MNGEIWVPPPLKNPPHNVFGIVPKSMEKHKTTLFSLHKSQTFFPKNSSRTPHMNEMAAPIEKTLQYKYNIRVIVETLERAEVLLASCLYLGLPINQTPIKNSLK